LKLVQSLFLIFSFVTSRPAVYVKGHSHAANEVRQKIASSTCYASGARVEDSVATLEVDHLVSATGRHWVVLVLVRRDGKILFEKKAEENPWPLPSTVNSLLRNLASSTCPSYARGRERNRALQASTTIVASRSEENSK
jgi:hypothetical protein